MTKTTPHQIRNWSKYNKALKRRGEITFWFDEEVLAHWNDSQKTGKRGRPTVYANEAIHCLLLIKSVFHLDFRKLEGFAESFMRLMQLSLKIPCYTQICRRQATLEVTIPALPHHGDLHIVVDSTGLKVYGEGEWKVRQHGYSKRRTWRKLHLGINESSGEIMASVLTTNNVADNEVIDDLLEQIEDEVNCLSADGAYDKQNCYDALDQRHIQANIPPRKDAVIKQHGNCKALPLTRDQNIRSIQKLGRKKWKQSVGYHRRSLAETAMYRFKTLFGGTLANRLFDHQATEAFIKCCAMNKMTQLGMPVYF
jgi:IS5 family transposase